MIVRISSEGQYKVDGELIKKLDDIDNRIVNVCSQDDSLEFKRLLDEMLDLVRVEGKALPVTDLVKSDVVLPAPDTTLEEAKEMFCGEGLIEQA